MKKKADKIVREFQSVASPDAPFPFTEAYKSLRTNLSFVSVNEQYKTIAVTSAIPGEGKSNVAINLTISLAESGYRVLLIDADLRKPQIHKYLKIAQGSSVGLTSILSGKTALNESIFYLADHRIKVICAGIIPPNPAELLGSRRMMEMLNLLKERFDYIIIDTPPISVVTDAAVLSRQIDGVIMVVRQKHCSIEAAQLAKKNLESVDANIIGAVLNGYSVKAANREDGYYYSYNYDYESE